MSDLDENYLEKDSGPFWKVRERYLRFTIARCTLEIRTQFPGQPPSYIFTESFAHKNTRICEFKVIQRYTMQSLCHIFVLFVHA